MTGQSQSLYRKWRSQTFSDLVGQEAVIQTLRQAVAQDRLTHAYLFSGPRGTGKTSTARLLAKMVNCTNPRDGEPCNECLSCTEITEGRSTDVFEIDAASNRGIDEIRDLRERVRIMSGTGKTRLYIIDEVHMLTTEAFNALLKTLEEPPPHVIFVLATTEAHKIPATVASRCQRFEFRRIALRDIIARMQYVSDQEGMRADPAALELIARAAQGGMRDALSLLDQARAFAGDAISAEAARAMLGMADPALVRGVIEFVAEADTAGGLHRINALAQSGVDLRQLANQIAELWRQLMLSRAGADLVALLDVTPDAATDLHDLASRFTLEALTECARIFARNDAGARTQVVPQLALELAFLDCVAAAQGRIAQTTPEPRPIAASTSSANRPPVAAPPTAPVVTPPIAQASAPTPPASMPDRPLAAEAPSSSATNGHAPIADAMSMLAEEIIPPPITPLPSVREAKAGYGQSEAALLQATIDQWNLIRQICKQKSATTAALLSDAFPVAVEGGQPIVVVIAAKYPFHADKLAQPLHRPHVEYALQQVLDVPCQARFILEKDAPGGIPTNGAAGAPPATNDPPPASMAARETATRSAEPPLPPSPTAEIPARRDKQSLIDAALRDPFIAKLVQDHHLRIVDAGPLKDFFPGR